MPNTSAPAPIAQELSSDDLTGLWALLVQDAGLAFPYLQFLADTSASDTAFHLGVKTPTGQISNAISLTQDGFVYAYVPDPSAALPLATLWQQDFVGWVTGMIGPRAHLDALYPLVASQLPPLFVSNLEQSYELPLMGLRPYRIDPAFRPPEETDYTALCAFRLGQMIERYGLQDSQALRTEVMDQVERDWFEESLLVLKGGNGAALGAASFKAAGKIARLDTLYMAPEWRGQGGGTILLTSLLGYLQQAGFTTVTSTVAPRHLTYYAEMLEQAGFVSKGDIATLLFAPPDDQE